MCTILSFACFVNEHVLFLQNRLNAKAALLPRPFMYANFGLHSILKVRMLVYIDILKSTKRRRKWFSRLVYSQRFIPDNLKRHALKLSGLIQ